MLEVQAETNLGGGEPNFEHASLHHGMVQQQILVQKNMVEVLGALAPHALEGPQLLVDAACDRRVKLGAKRRDVVVGVAQEEQRDVRLERRDVLLEGDVGVHRRLQKYERRPFEVELVRRGRWPPDVQVDDPDRFRELDGGGLGRVGHGFRWFGG